MARRPRTPEAPGLSRASVVAAAFDLVDREGVEALSIRRLAERLEVRGPSLYYHFKSKAELVDLLVDAALEAVLGEIDTARLERDWRSWLERLARSYREILQRHRGLTSLMALRLPNGPNGLAIYDATLGLLLDSGFTPRDAVAAYVSVSNYVLSSVQREPSSPSDERAAVWSLAEVSQLAGAVAATPGRYPALAVVAGEALRLTSDALFDYGLAAILNGIGPEY